MVNLQDPMLNKDLFYVNPHNMMLYNPYMQGVLEQNILFGPAERFSSSNSQPAVQLNDDVYQIIAVDPINGINAYTSLNPEPCQVPFVNNPQQVNEGLEVLNLICNQSKDIPEYVDINECVVDSEGRFVLSSSLRQRQFIEEPARNAQEDDDDVIFVGEYKCKTAAPKPEPVKVEKKAEPVSEAPASNAVGPRRNPHRKARKNARDVTRNLLFDDDFALTGSSSEENLIITEPIKKPARAQALLAKEMKKWPVNGLHERPEYNETTQQIEKFDSSIRKIQDSVQPLSRPPPAPPRKTAGKTHKKPKKKHNYFGRRRSNKTKVEEKCPISDLKDLVNSTTEGTVSYINDLRKLNKILFKDSQDEEMICSEEEKNRAKEDRTRFLNVVKSSLDLLHTQTVLFKITSGTSSNQELIQLLDKLK